jgi:hypothetical protein
MAAKLVAKLVACAALLCGAVANMSGQKCDGSPEQVWHFDAASGAFTDST